MPAPRSPKPHDHPTAWQSGHIQFFAPGRDTRSPRSLNAEWVQISNNTRKAVNLNGWTLSDCQGHTYTFRQYRLEGRSTVRVHTGIGCDARHDLYQDRRTYVWNNDSDTATLRNSHHKYVDSVTWGHRYH